MPSSEKLTALACVLAAAALTAGCVPAINYGSVPPEPDLTTRATTTTLGTTTHKPFTTRKHSAHTISWAEYSGEYKRSTTTGQRGTGTETGTYTGTYTGTNTGTGTGASGSGLGSDTGHSQIPNETDMPQTVTQTVKPDTPDEPMQTPAPVTDPPHEDPPQTAAPQPDEPAE